MVSEHKAVMPASLPRGGTQPTGRQVTGVSRSGSVVAGQCARSLPSLTLSQWNSSFHFVFILTFSSLCPLLTMFTLSYPVLPPLSSDVIRVRCS